jgi:hypothetical protein
MPFSGPVPLRLLHHTVCTGTCPSSPRIHAGPTPCPSSITVPLGARRWRSFATKRGSALLASVTSTSKPTYSSSIIAPDPETLPILLARISLSTGSAYLRSLAASLNGPGIFTYRVTGASTGRSIGLATTPRWTTAEVAACPLDVAGASDSERCCGGRAQATSTSSANQECLSIKLRNALLGGVQSSATAQGEEHHGCDTLDRLPVREHDAGEPSGGHSRNRAPFG